MNRRNQSGRIALAGMLSALAVVILTLGSLVDVVELSAAALASFAVMVAVLELGPGCAVGVFAVSAVLSFIVMYDAVSAVLSLLLFPMRIATVTFALFFGYYPVLKVYLDKLRVRPLRWAVKFACFNAFLVLAALLLGEIAGLEAEVGEAKWLYGALLALGNATLAVYDVAVARISLLYIKKCKNRMRK